MPDLRGFKTGQTKETEGVSDYIKAIAFQAVNFFDKRAVTTDGKMGREIIIIYSLGEDGIIREFAGGKWIAFPIKASE